MGRSSSLDGLIKWAGREEWSGLFDDVLCDHYEEVCEEWGVELDFEELGQILGEEVATVLWGCAFEHFLTRPGEDERTIVDDYLKRRGWKENASSRRYMEALRDSVMSLYEVSDIVPGQSFLARDLVRGGEPVRVSEHSASRVLKPWDRIAVRIVEVSGRHLMSGGLLRFDHELAAELLEEMKAERDVIGNALAKAAEESAADAERIDPELMDTLLLFTAAPLITSLWLDDALARVLGEEEPEVFNSDGDPVEFHTLRYPFNDTTTAGAVRERMRRVPGFREENENFWNWVDSGEPAGAAGTQATTASVGRGHVYRVSMDDGAEVLGNIALEDGALVASANSESRAGVARAIIFDVAGDLLGTPQVSLGAPQAASDEDGDDLPLSEEEKAAILGKVLREHYEQVLDQPIPALGRLTPRAAAETPEGRAEVVAWLKLLENGSARLHVGEGDVDLVWMWRELGVEDQRK